MKQSNNRTIKKLIITFFTIFTIQVQSFPVYAQIASSSAGTSVPTDSSPTVSPVQQQQIGNSPTPSLEGTPTSPTPQISPTVPNPFVQEGPLGSPTTSVQSLGSQITSSLHNTPALGSAFIRQQSSVHKLAKNSFKSDEAITLVVGNTQAENVAVSLTDPQGKQVDNSEINKTTVDTQTNITVNPPQFAFKPGKYTLHIRDSDGTTSTQNFTWGVLAINTNKSVYTPNETADIAMAVLDDQGNMVCDAKLELRITNYELRIDDTISTDNGKITINSQCQSHGFSLKPDYEATYQLGKAGIYTMTLTATTKNGTYSIDDTIKVMDSVSFDVERVAATRIFPPNSYPVLFHIKANQDFNGAVTEYVPAGFDVKPYSDNNSYTFTSTKTIVPEYITQKAFGVSNLSLGNLFAGNYPLVQGFGVKMTDPLEAPFYASFGLVGHDGLDFGLPSGTPLFAADDGTVEQAGEGVYGVTIIIDHSWGKSYYGHLSKLLVKEGDTVKKGQEIALSGATGHVTGPHLHFGIKPKYPLMDNGYYGKVDPIPYMDLPQSDILADKNLDTQTSSLLATTAVLEASTSASKTDYTSTATIDNKVKAITWNITLKKGDSVTLSYAFKAPQISPQFYQLGPLTFYPRESLSNPRQSVFAEQRQWQIAADAVGTPWYDQSWQYRKQITIDHTKVSGGSDLSNFPVLVNLSSDTDLKNKSQSSGNDILFTDSTGVAKLNHAIEKYDNTTGQLLAWVNIPTLSSSSDTTLYMYYGNAAASNQQNASGVWDSSYLGVWHMSDNAANTTVADSSSNSNTGTNAANTSTKTTAGEVGSGLTYNGTSDNTNTTSAGSIKGQAQVTISAWINFSTLDSTQRIVYEEVTNANNSTKRLALAIGASGCTNNKLCLVGRTSDGDGNTVFESNTTTLSTGTWYYVVAVYDATNSINHLMINGTDQTNSRSELSFSSTTPAHTPEFAEENDGSHFFGGTLDEVRVSKTARSVGWSTSEYNNQSSPSTFITLGNVETKNYAPAIGTIMRHGKYFYNGALQPMSFAI